MSTTEVIATAKTIEQAVANGAAKLGLSADEVQYDVLDVPVKGFLGLGGIDAKVRVYVETEPEDEAKAYLDELIRRLGVNAEAVLISQDDGRLCYDLRGEDLGPLVGRHGETLDALQQLTNLMLCSKSEEKPNKIHLDAGGYRAKREESVGAAARRTAERALKYRRNITMEPMSSYDRRIVHSVLQDVEGVTTHSVGEEPNRRVVVSAANAARSNSRRGR
ncbi:MAG: protein jag [Clostridia bacterium]|nr:protein jag [Clostridia bacterium]